MQDWILVRGSQEVKPLEVDTASSKDTVYLRKNIEQITETDTQSGKEITLWQYMERQMTREEYVLYQMIQEQTKNIKAYTTQDAIDEYTKALIEQGQLG